MRTVEIQMTVAVRIGDRSNIPVDTLVDALTERFPWVSGVIVDAVTVYENEEVAS